MNGSGTVLMFNISDPDKQAAVRLTALRLGVRCLEVPPGRQHQTLEALLAGREPESAPAGEPFSEELLVLAGLPSETFHALLDTLRREGQTVRLKAVMTEHNRTWPAARLYRELRAEAEAMEKRKKALHPSGRKKHR